LALVPAGALITALYVTIVIFRERSLTPHLALICSTVVAALVARRLGHRFAELEAAMVHGISMASKACLILLVIGMLVGSWIHAGIVPAMIYFGLDLLSPAIFLVATCLICAVVSLATGSSWSTAATVGIALIGVGEGLGLDRAQVAGAIISGAYFGDKMSPLSDTTNLAPAMAGAKLFDHIRHMVFTTTPSLLVALVIYALLGGGGGHADGASVTQVEAIRAVLKSSYDLNMLLVLPPLLIIVLVVLRVPALPALVGGWALGGLMAFLVQGRPLGEILKVAYAGVNAKTGHKLVDKLLSRGGMSSMFSTILLIICALSFGGVMEKSGMLGSLAGSVLALARGDGTLVLATILTCTAMNILGSDQYLAVVVPGRMYRNAYRERRLAPRNLSRALEDSGTLTSVLIPWNTCGAFMIATLGVKPWSYVPFCLLNLLNPLVSIFYGFTGITMAPLEAEEEDAEEQANGDA